MTGDDTENQTTKNAAKPVDTEERNDQPGEETRRMLDQLEEPAPSSNDTDGRLDLADRLNSERESDPNRPGAAVYAEVTRKVLDQLEEPASVEEEKVAEEKSVEEPAPPPSPFDGWRRKGRTSGSTSRGVAQEE
ncbi:hypothetical protein FIBSPDRAFT_955472 [Athelia psychrophila]|uniref:Uncharacterized protein n=1 Tax=Athelia psychrophila TaxID=1759441 RepID=A0A166HY78_9AGAM|nr:hypothetical protein FIBSPDRAFT_955472 [Fibularhizoctonia sp. CBS 109695]